MNREMRVTRSVIRLRWIFSIFLVGFVFGRAYAQSSSKMPELVSFQTPKTLYFSGEKIWFDATVLMGNQPAASQVLYAELVNRNSVSVLHVKVPLIS